MTTICRICKQPLGSLAEINDHFTNVHKMDGVDIERDKQSAFLAIREQAGGPKG